MQLNNKTILIIGGNSAICREAIKQFLAEEMNVIVCCSYTDEFWIIKKNFPETVVLNCDIKDEADVYILHQLTASIGGIDILHNAATDKAEFSIAASFAFAEAILKK